MTLVEAWLGSVVTLGALFWPLEWAWPARAAQARLRPHLGTDLLFLSGQYLLWNGLSLWVLQHTRDLVCVDGLQAAFRTVPLVVQLVVVVLLGDLCVYWLHRASHRFEVLWRFHAVHHTAEHLDWVAAHREHPVDGVVTQLSLNLPGLVLGLDFRALAGLVVFRGLWALFIHSNVRVPLGPLGWLCGSPQWHRWHHAKAPGVVSNFGNLSPWCDVVFGTHHPGVAGDEAFPMGVPERWPASWPGQLVAPLLPRRWWAVLSLLDGGRSRVQSPPCPETSSSSRRFLPR